MKCMYCNSNDANTHYKRVINGKSEELYLCDNCASELGIFDEFDFEGISFENFLRNGSSAINSIIGIDRCSHCGSSIDDIINTGAVGCAYCYEKFENRLKPSIEKFHGKAKHTGKAINKSSVGKDYFLEIENLKQELRAAVIEQRFEDAVNLRDRIKVLSEENNNE